MDPAASEMTNSAPPPSGLHRLLLATSGAGVLVTLAWAALQVRQLQLETQSLRQELAVAQRAERAAGAASRAVPVTDHGARATELQRRLTEVEAQQKQAAEKAAAREKELDKVIDFLRQENTAAQQTIERLSNPPPAPAPPVVPKVTPKPATRPAVRPVANPVRKSPALEP